MSQDFETALERELAAAGNHRRDKVFAVAYLYHRHGRAIPGASEMRTLVGRGSLTDITRDLKDFRTVTQEKATQLTRLPGLPRDLELKIGEVMEGLWHTLYERAEAEFEQGRAESDKKVVVLEQTLDDSEKERLQALDERQIVLARSAELERQLAAVSTQLRQAESTITDQQGQIKQLQGRVGELDAKLGSQAREHSAIVVGLQDTLKERENRIQDFRVQEDRLKAAYEEKLSTARMLENEYRQRVQVAEDTANRMRDQFAESNAERAAQAKKLEELSRALTDVTRIRDGLAQDLIQRNAAVEAANARLEAAAREREGREKEIARLREEAKAATEAAAELRGRLVAALDHNVGK